MSETFEQLTFWPEVGTSALSRAASRANQPQSPANVSALRIPAGSGPNTSGLSWISSLSGYLRRTCQVFYRSGNQDRCSLIWRRRVTKSGRSSWVLGRSVPRTNGTGCGLWDDWPTPNAQIIKECVDPLAIAERRRKADEGLTVHKTLGLREAVANWPTPRTEDSEQAGAHRGTPDTLTSAARVDWFTPQSLDWKDSGPTQGNRKDINLGVQACRCAGQSDLANPSTSGKPRDWPTPVASEGGEGTTPENRGKKLHIEVKTGAGQLSPDWVEQLQGLPDGWTRLPDATVSRLLATRTRRTSRT